jgi:hypothetical protein
VRIVSLKGCARERLNAVGRRPQVIFDPRAWAKPNLHGVDVPGRDDSIRGADEAERDRFVEGAA